MQSPKQPEQAAPAGADPLDLPGFDTARALARLGGNEPLLRRLRRLFRHNYQAAATDLRAAWDQDDVERVRALAHTLKGVAATIGAEAVASAAASLEQVARDAPADRDGKALQALERVLGETLERLAAEE